MKIEDMIAVMEAYRDGAEIEYRYIPRVGQPYDEWKVDSYITWNWPNCEYRIKRRSVDDIDWREAPEWAQWVAVDKTGRAFWYEVEPYHNGGEVVWMCGDRYRRIDGLYDNSDWKHSLRGRPVDHDEGYNCNRCGSTYSKASDACVCCDMEEDKLKTVDDVDWLQAPEWAQWVAVDEDGKANWYESKPRIVDDQWVNRNRWFPMRGNFDASDWRNSLRERPVDHDEGYACNQCGSTYSKAADACVCCDMEEEPRYWSCPADVPRDVVAMRIKGWPEGDRYCLVIEEGLLMVRGTVTIQTVDWADLSEWECYRADGRITDCVCEGE